jgi:putative addiction module CopG family antidote
MSAETINVTLPAEIVRAIREEVDHGAYASADEVIEEALRLRLGQEDERDEPELTASMREKIRQSLAEPGPDVPMEEVFDALERRLRESR